MSRSKITPQLQAVGKGFSNIDPGYTKLTRMREDSDRKVAQLTEQERDWRERDLKAEADVERVMATQKATVFRFQHLLLLFRTFQASA